MRIAKTRKLKELIRINCYSLTYTDVIIIIINFVDTGQGLMTIVHLIKVIIHFTKVGDSALEK